MSHYSSLIKANWIWNDKIKAVVCFSKKWKRLVTVSVCKSQAASERLRLFTHTPLRLLVWNDHTMLVVCRL